MISTARSGWLKNMTSHKANATPPNARVKENSPRYQLNDARMREAEAVKTVVVRKSVRPQGLCRFKFGRPHQVLPFTSNCDCRQLTDSVILRYVLVQGEIAFDAKRGASQSAYLIPVRGR
jgi:hypothetical protein